MPGLVGKCFDALRITRRTTAQERLLTPRPLSRIDIDDDEEDDKKGAADSDNESMPSLASMEDSEDEAFKPKKPASTKAAPHSPTDKKKKDDDSFNALMKRSGTIKRLSDIKENEERVKRDGGAGAEAKLKSLQAERERLEASLAPGVAAKLASKPAPARPSSGTAPKPKLAQGDFDDMPPLEGTAFVHHFARTLELNTFSQTFRTTPLRRRQRHRTPTKPKLPLLQATLRTTTGSIPS